MSTDPTGGFAPEHEAVLRGFGLGPSDLADPGDGGGPTERLRRGLARSARGVEAPRQYWATAPAFQLGSALERFGYDLRLEAPDGGGIEPSGGFEVVLAGEATTRRTSFRYPDGGHGRDDYPALVGAVESRLLPDALGFVRLADDGDHWRFFLARDRALERLRDRFGERIVLDGEPLLAERQPGDAFCPALVDEAGEDRDPSAGEIPAGGIESAFESLERAAVTGPVDPADRGEELDLSEVAPELDGGPAVVREVPGDRLEDVVDDLASAGGAIESSGGPGGSPMPSDPEGRRGSRAARRTDGGSASLASRIERLEDRASDVSRGSGGEGRADRTPDESRANRTHDSRANRTQDGDRGDGGHAGDPAARDVDAGRPRAGPDEDTGGGLSSKVAAALDDDAGATGPGRTGDARSGADGVEGLGGTEPEAPNSADPEDANGAGAEGAGRTGTRESDAGAGSVLPIGDPGSSSADASGEARPGAAGRQSAGSGAGSLDGGADPATLGTDRESSTGDRPGTGGSSGSGDGSESDSGRYPDWRLDLEGWADDTSEAATPAVASSSPSREDSSGGTAPDDRAGPATDREDAGSEQSAVERLSETVDRLL